MTPRTTGFNTLDIGALRDSTTLMKMTLLLATVAFFRRQQALHAFGRSPGAMDVMKVLALTTVSMLMVLSGIFLVAIHHDGEFLDLAFKVTSAFGRVLMMVFMFFGRAGPPTLGFFLATRSVPRLRYPAGQPHLG
ncbi:hypothetical protein [Rubrimonas cliftonensis]|uniref:Trk system potassium uptake protein TrkH n=1 Tax=Rubrimonas cliftonensis TaxID=89524 RepID=A0A1H4EEW5_9RHOB|nr:trk system potassium uptake protein TrkH [Rubrimonas cliftonensis]